MLATAGPASASGPAVSVDQAASQADPASSSPIQFTAVFSASVTGFDSSDVDLSQSTAGGTLVASVTGGPSTYTISVSGMTSNGEVVVTIPASAAEGASSNLSLASTSTDNKVTWVTGTTPPTVTVNQAASQADPASSSPIRFTATFSAPVTGLTGADVSFFGSSAGGHLTAAVSGGPTTYTISVSGMTTEGTVVAALPAGAALGPQNAPSLASTSSDAIVTWRPPVPPPAKSSVLLLSSCSSSRPCVTTKGGRSLPLKVGCEGPAACAATMTVTVASRGTHARPGSKPKASTLGKLGFTLSAGATKALSVPLKKRARSLLAGGRRVKATLTIVLASTTNTYAISLRMPKPGRSAA
jgi:hypothetical protein